MSCDVGEVMEMLENEQSSPHLCHSSFSNPSFASSTSQALHFRNMASCPCYEYSSILLCARTRKVFTTFPIPAVAFKETTNSPSPPTPFKYFRRKILLTRQTDCSATQKQSNVAVIATIALDIHRSLSLLVAWNVF